MLPLISRSGPALPGFSHTVSAITNSLRPVASPVLKAKPPTPAHPAKPKVITQIPSHTVNLFGASSVRYAHSDVTVPDFSAYRKQMKDDRNNFREAEDQRKLNTKTFNYAVSAGLWMGGLYTAKATVTMFLKTMSASADVLALASIEIPMSDVPEGQSITFKWRGKPLFVRHRTAEEIERERSVAISELRDPQHDVDRTQVPNFLVVVGVCTHLGCVPIANAGDFGGYYCPCHGSHYDASGRIRKGPAPLNLEVPEYYIMNDEILKVG